MSSSARLNSSNSAARPTRKQLLPRSAAAGRRPPLRSCSTRQPPLSPPRRRPARHPPSGPLLLLPLRPLLLQLVVRAGSHQCRPPPSRCRRRVRPRPPSRAPRRGTDARPLAPSSPPRRRSPSVRRGVRLDRRRWPPLTNSLHPHPPT